MEAALERARCDATVQVFTLGFVFGLARGDVKRATFDFDGQIIISKSGDGN